VSAPALTDAVAAFDSGDLARATDLAREILRTANENAEAWSLLAAIADRRGQTADGITVLRHALAQMPRASALHVALGNLQAKSGQLTDAEASWRYALAIDHENQAAPIFLAGLLAQSGRFVEADILLTSALTLYPDNPAFHFHLGRIRMLNGGQNDARAPFERAAALTKNQTGNLASFGNLMPRHADVQAHLGTLLFLQGALLEAVDYLRDAVTADAGAAARTQFINCVMQAPFTAPRPDLKPLLVQAFEQSWALPSEIVWSAVRLLRLEPEFIEAAAAIEKPSENLLGNGAIRAVTADPLLRAVMAVTFVADPTLERLLGAIRAALLSADPNQRTTYLPFAASLANQCFLEEHIYPVTAAENDRVQLLEQKITSALDGDNDVDPFDLAVLAAYKPLLRVAGAEKISARAWPQDIAAVVRWQVTEPIEERDIAKSIPQLTPVSDPMSQAVRDQYQEFPYPRWTQAPFRSFGFTLEEWLQRYLPHMKVTVAHRGGPLEVLDAGCGTGQESIAIAHRFANTNILAVDLSLPSLAFAARKTAELGLVNITYAQADVLELGNIGRKFDVVESGGVLHHLANPLQGWRVLADLTKPGGYMILALYSAQGRRDLEAATTFIKAGGYGNTADDIRRFRQDVLALPPDNPVHAIANTRNDFYNLSMLRDLLFHVQEHTFTVAKIGAAVKDLGLQFCGFAFDPRTRAHFQSRFGKQTDFGSLSDWELFENENPDTFASMYHFIVRKPD
jgi:2-polyprenyl-3-methyl-5-hydroxy-6-metoxy-1,4-benzoquinol methylase/Flp pilus assembly protein TadD